MLTRTFTLTDVAILKADVLALAARASSKDRAMQPTLDALVAWLGSVMPIHGFPVRLADAALADLLDGLAFPDDPKLDAVRTAYVAYLRRPQVPPPPPDSTPTDPPSDDGAPIPHGDVVLNLLAMQQPWVAGSLTRIAPDFPAWLRRYCLGGSTRLVIADMAALPDEMRRAGFHGRDNALYYTVSRSYAGWPWHGDENDPDAHLSDQRQELSDFWSNYLDVILHTMHASPETTGLFLLNDAGDRCGDVLSEYSLRQLDPVAGRIERGDVFQGVLPSGLGSGRVPVHSGVPGFWD